MAQTPDTRYGGARRWLSLAAVYEVQLQVSAVASRLVAQGVHAAVIRIAVQEHGVVGPLQLPPHLAGQRRAAGRQGVRGL